jgi:dTMP kinase
MATLPDGTPLPGKLFIVEGIDGSGKSTQLDLVHKWLTSQGYCVSFSEWNSSPLVKRTTKRGKKKQLLTPTTFSLMAAVDFAHRHQQQILPALKAGGIVLADRYIYTGFARDVAREVDREWVRQIYSFAVRPTVALYFKVPLEESLRRIMSGRPTLKHYEAGLDLGLSEDPYESYRIFQGRILREYERITGEFDLTVVDAAQPLVVQQESKRSCARSSPHTWRARYGASATPGARC